MSKQSSIDKIDKELGVTGNGSAEYEALKTAMFNWFSGKDLEEFVQFLESEN